MRVQDRQYNWEIRTSLQNSEYNMILLEKVIAKAVKRLKNKGKLEGVKLSNSHKKDSGIDLSEVDEKGLVEYISKITNVAFLHGIEPAKESWHKINGFWRPIINAGIIELCKYLPYIPGLDKNHLYRAICIELGKNTTIAPRVQFDYFHPELIEIGDYCLIGDGAKFWTHDAGIDSLMLGPIKIGNYVKIGSESVIGPCTVIEDNSIINFGAFIYASRIPRNSKVLGREKAVYKENL